ncbi:unnamed protein product, partial [Vitis vinifera]
MEAKIGGEAHHFYGIGTSDLRVVGKRSSEWDSNEWKWDGDLFIASPMNPVPSDYTSQQFFPHGSAIPKRKRELEKRRRVIVVQDDNDETGTLSLKLGGHGHSVSEREVGNWEGTSGKKTKLAGVSSSRAVCQVEDCGADLSKAKDYHRRHKVCEMHSKAGCALVGNDMQRFCQQCSRFHVLQEFDEGKRSCRRRLAGHNKRRRKTHPDAAGNGNSLNDDQASGYLLISLLRILSNMHSNDKSDQTKDQDLLSHLLRSLASYGGTNGSRNISGLLQESQLLNDGISVGNTEVVSALLPNGVHADEARVGNMQMTSWQIKLNNFDLNDIYIDSDDGMEDLERSPVPENLGTGSLECPSWVQQDSHQSSPPQTSGNSDSASAQSPSSSSGEAQSRTDRIVFKLFGKEPNDFPLVLRAQILDWLSHSPTDIESYIRPGCIVLTIYLRLPESTWEELCCDLGSSLSRLLDVSNDTFWRTGWVYIRVQHQIAFIYNGQVVVDMSLPLKTNNYSKILSIKPIAISMSEEAQFLVKGFNLSRPATRLLCALEGKYLVKEATHELMDDIDSVKEHDELQYLNFSCSIPKMTGRGFIEVEDHGLSSSFFPIIVAEKDVCSEICMLESTIEMTDIDEDGYLFSFKRFKWLMEFSMDRDWCAVVKKLLDIMLDGTVGAGEYPSLKLAFMEMGLLHRAVRRNSRPLVELLLRYVPERGGRASFLLRPDVVGPAGLTPLHIAAGRDGSEDVLDALTDDPGMVGVEAWKSARDSTGFTPEDYARLRGHYSYIHLVQKKINRRLGNGHVVVDQCKRCNHKVAYGNASRSLLYRPAMLSMVAIAAVCVCVALLFKSSPEVLYVFTPFRWELLDYGTS